MKKHISSKIPPQDLLQSLSNKDSNSDRKRIIISCIKATEFALENRFDKGVTELKRILSREVDKSIRKKEALRYLILLLQNYNVFKENSLFDFYSFVKSNIKLPIANLNTGGIKTFYESFSYQQFAICVNNEEDSSIHRTIHKAKGAEFDNVLLILKNRNDLVFLLNPDLKDEEQRINYVAISRAKKQLFITIPPMPALFTSDKEKLKKIFDFF